MFSKRMHKRSTEESLRKFLAPGLKKRGPAKPGRGRKAISIFTPAEILFEVQLQARGYIEIDIALRTMDPFKYERHVIGPVTRIKGLEPGEIMKLRRDLQGFLVWWRGELARERQDTEVTKRMEIEEGE